MFLEGRFICAGSFEGELVRVLARSIGTSSVQGGSETPQADVDSNVSWVLRCRWESRDEHVANACFTAINRTSNSDTSN